MSKERIEVFGGNRCAVLDDFKSIELFSERKRKKVKSMAQDKGHNNEINTFIKALSDGGESPISFDSQVRVSRATFAAMESLYENRSVKLGSS